MEIKEIENLLSISRSNIRFYEKEGLIKPERHENNYRNYNEKDVALLKKIIVLRKLGFSVEEIAAMQKGDLSLSNALEENITRLEEELEQLKGSLETAKSLAAENTTFENLDQEKYWNTITQAENNGEKFIDIYKDYLVFELELFDKMWKNVFFHDFKKSRQKHGVLKACIILLIICVLRGIGRKFIWQESFWQGFLYPFAIAALGTIAVLPLYILKKKAPKAAEVISVIITIISFLFFGLLALIIIYGIIRAIVT